MLKETTPIIRRKKIVVQDLDNELLVYDLKANKAFCLNETSALVFGFCRGIKTVSEITAAMSAKLKTPVSEDLVWLALEELKKNDLLEDSDDLTDQFAGLTRREAVKKVGFASMIALPIVSSVVAPNAAMAQSGATLLVGQACTPGQCISGNCRSVNGGPSPACCAPTTNGNPTFGPGRLPGCYADAATCNTAAPLRCCSGSGTFTANGAGCPATGICSCNPY
ncbi:MAG: hypothetical protein HKN25_01870 [Pyrinomonadaceae bacterium]|nr:hypothetical protein [Pyrinomonadaceae bacterium]